MPGPMKDAPPTLLSALSGDTARKIEIFKIKSYFIFDVSALHTPRAVESVALGLQSRQTGSEESHVSNKKCLLYHKIQTVSNLHMF